MSVVVSVLFLGCGGSTDPGGTNATSLTLSPSQLDTLFAIGSTAQLTVAALDAQGNPISNPNVTFTSSSAAIAEVGVTGIITARGNGSATITVTSGSATDSRVVRVRQKYVRLDVSPTTVQILPGRTASLTLAPRDPRNFIIAGLTGATFSSSDPAVATVSNSGVVNSLTLGSTVITATLTTADGSFQATSNVTVTNAFPTTARIELLGSEFSPNTVDIAAGGSVTFANVSSTEHNVLFSGSSGVQNIPNHTTGSSVRVFQTAGTFPFDCSLHAGMSGTVIVH